MPDEIVETHLKRIKEYTDLHNNLVNEIERMVEKNEQDT